ncbi:hypothetical protein, variant 1 [Aphanomyces invadans]|uniref:Uncharacterized protein n=1 Tax=Aphanomyces invadans TaxID=157072 RepID=A0A024TCN4_9STRA|nr:hypothetical protein, variant 1 [Aphanomyces invadans]ETV91885.1 hypothetical protein, variant 1 [Aphanomyces invadans]|eukprot:XP_008879523.1 hypothetical protein, variant 1 [Aphanomyces invadans]
MGTTGSVEQRNAIKDVILISDSSAKKRTKDDIMRVLQTFCLVFPFDMPERRRRTDSSEENAAAASMDVKEKRLFDSVHRLLKSAVDNTATNNAADESDVVLLILDTFKRLLQWRELHKLVPKYSIKPFLTCMMWSPALASSVLDVLLMMITRPTGLKTVEVGDKIEMLNKRTLADDLGFQVLGSLLAQHHPSSVLSAPSSAEPILEASLRIFHWTYVGNKLTSDAVTLDRVTDSLLNARLTLLHLAHHRGAACSSVELYPASSTGPSSLRHLAADLLLELFSVADVAQVTVLQDTARDCGALLYMMSYALDTAPDEVGQHMQNGELTADKIMDEASPPLEDGIDRLFREKAVALVEMFCAGNSRSKAAVYRMLPVDLFVPIEDRPDLVSKYTLASIRKSTKSTTSSSLLLGPFRSEPRFNAQSVAPSSSMLASALYTSSSSVATPATHIEFQRWLHDARTQGETWQEVLVAARDEHVRPNLIWRREMLRELQLALRREIARLEANVLSASSRATTSPLPRSSSTALSSSSMQLWDAEQFTVRYASFQRELVVHGYFLDPLLPKLSNLNDPFEVQDHVLLAWHVLDRVAVETNPLWRLRCIKCVRLLLRRYAMTFNGQLPMQSLLQQLQRATSPADPPTHAFATECFWLFHVAISTSRTRTADSLVTTYDAIVATVVAALHAAISSRRFEDTRASDTDGDDRRDADRHDVHRLMVESGNDDDDDDVDRTSEHVHAHHARTDGEAAPDDGGVDAMVRAGVNVLAVLVQRAKSYVPQVLAARDTLVRVFHTVLRPSTLEALLGLVEHLLPHLTNAGATACGSFLEQVLPAVLSACSNPCNAGRMTHAASAFLAKYISPSLFQTTLRNAVGHDGCGLHLVLADPTVLAAIFNADSVQAADVLWGATLRHRLFSSLHQEYYTVVSDGGLCRRLSNTVQKSDSGEFFDAQPDSSTDLDICVGHLFLRSFVEQEGSFRTTWTDAMYRTTIDALLQQLMKSRGSFVAANNDVDDPMEVQVLVLRALRYLLPRGGHNVPMDARVLEVLLSPLKRSLLSEVDQARGGVGLQLLAHVMTPPNVNASHALAVVESSFALLQDVVDKTLQPRYVQFVREQVADPPQHHVDVAMTLVTAFFELLVVVASHDPGAFDRRPSLLSKLFAYLSDVPSCPQLAFAALHCVSRLCQVSSVLPPMVLVDGGGVVFLSHLLATTPSSPETSAVVTAAATILQANAALLNAVLVQLFTPGLVEVLATDGPAAFVVRLHCADDVWTARLIWTIQMQATLNETLRREVANVAAAAKDAARWPVWFLDHFVAADSYRYLYADVADEVVVGGVYLRLFVQQDILSMPLTKIHALAAVQFLCHR